MPSCIHERAHTPRAPRPTRRSHAPAVRVGRISCCTLRRKRRVESVSQVASKSQPTETIETLHKITLAKSLAAVKMLLCRFVYRQ